MTVLSTTIDNIGLFKKLHDINVTTIPLNPFELISLNRWQLGTYQLFSQIIGMSIIEIEEQISPRAFAFYSSSYKTYFIIYNSNVLLEKIRFNLAHEIGHILYGHISFNVPLVQFEDSNRLERDALADGFARFVLGKNE